MTIRHRLACWFSLILLAFTASAQQPVPTPPATASPAPVAGSAAPSSVDAAGPAASPQTNPAGQTAAPPTAANTIRTTARLVILDAVVVDKKGNVATDLTRDQFQIQEDGADQTLQNFTAPGRFVPPPDATIDSTADLDRLAPRAPVNIILLDEFNTRFEDMAFARYSLAKWLKAQPEKLDTPTMLVAVSLEKFEVLRDYTQNKDEILSSLDHHFSAYPWQAHNFSWVPERYATAFFTLRRVAEASIGHPGHKTMIWIGRGLPNIRSQLTALDQDHVHNAIQQTVNELRDARVTLYTIDPAGVLVDPGVYGEEAKLFEPFGGEANFKDLARATGGRNLFGRNDVDAEIGTSIRDGASFYTLTYRPTNTQRDISHFRRIKVTVVGRPDLTVVTRQGYFDSRAPARLTADGQINRRLESELAGAGTSTMVYDAVPLTVSSAPDGTKLVVHVAGSGISWSSATDTEPRRAKLILTVTTFDRKNNPLHAEALEINVPAPATVPPTGRLNRSLDLNYPFPKDSKAVRLRFVVRNNTTGRMGTADVDLLHPPPQTAANTTVTPAAAAQP